MSITAKHKGYDIKLDPNGLPPIKFRNILDGHPDGIAFREVEGALAIVYKSKEGLCFETTVHTQKDYVCVKIGKGYARIYKGGGTTKAGHVVENIDVGDLIVGFDDMGRLVLLGNEAALKAKASEMRRAVG
jgi:hypothetical protein